jgi:hypothetical protein
MHKGPPDKFRHGVFGLMGRFLHLCTCQSAVLGKESQNRSLVSQTFQIHTAFSTSNAADSHDVGSIGIRIQVCFSSPIIKSIPIMQFLMPALGNIEQIFLRATAKSLERCFRTSKAGQTAFTRTFLGSELSLMMFAALDPDHVIVDDCAREN